MRTNTCKSISQLTLTIAVSLAACTVEEQPDPAPIPTLSGADGTGGGDGADGTGGTATGADDGSGDVADESGSGADDDTGGSDCSPTVTQFGCVGVMAVVYCGEDPDFPCRLAAIGETVPRICTYAVPNGGAILEEMIVCETVAASEDEVVEACHAMAAGIPVIDLDRPPSIDIDVGNGNETWPGEVVWIPSGENNPYNGADGFCQTETSNPVFPLTDAEGLPIACEADQCVVEATDCTGYDISGASARAKRGSNIVKASIPLDQLDALRANTGLGASCDNGRYAFLVNAEGAGIGGYFKNADYSTLYRKLGFKNGDELKEAIIYDTSGNEQLMPMITYADSYEVLSLLPEPGNPVHMRFDVLRKGKRGREDKTVFIDFQTTE